MLTILKKLSRVKKLLLSSVIMMPLFLVNEAPAKQQSYFQVPQLSVQLWSVKSSLKADFKGTLTQLAAMGFAGVEFAQDMGEFKNDAKGLKQFLDSLNLKASGAHVSFEQLNAQNFAKTIAFYQTLGVDSLVIGWDERAWHPQGVKEIVKLLNDIDDRISPYNIKVGFHNHAQEFGTFQNDTYWDYIATSTGDSVVLQLDVGWVTAAGLDPIAYVEKYPNRTLTTHYKAWVSEGSKDRLPIIGQDSADWLNLLKANIAVGGTKWIVIEQEEYPNDLSDLAALNLSKLGIDAYIKQLQ